MSEDGGTEAGALRAAESAVLGAAESGALADLFRYGGGLVLALPGALRRYLRDALAARQHIGVSEENFERAGRSRVERAERLLLLSGSRRDRLKMVDR